MKQYWNGTIKISSITMHGVWQWTVCSAVSRYIWRKKAKDAFSMNRDLRVHAHTRCRTFVTTRPPDWAKTLKENEMPCVVEWRELWFSTTHRPPKSDLGRDPRYSVLFEKNDGFGRWRKSKAEKKYWKTLAFAYQIYYLCRRKNTSRPISLTGMNQIKRNTFFNLIT